MSADSRLLLWSGDGVHLRGSLIEESEVVFLLTVEVKLCRE